MGGLVIENIGNLEKGHVRVIEKINNELNCLTQKQNKRKKKMTSRDKERRKKYIYERHIPM